MKGIALLLASAAISAAQDDPVEVLMRVRDNVLAHGERIPNHTCVETITRDVFDYAAGPPPRSCDALLGRRRRAGAGTLLRIASTDRLRLDVALAAAQEIYSWAGAGKFEEGTIVELVPNGAIGSGPFAATLLGIFEASDPKFVFEGEQVRAGRRLLEYSFHISAEDSHYQVRAGDQWLATGYSGNVLADPASSDLVSVTVRTEELPRAANACEVDTVMEYGMVHLGSSEYLLPTMTRERFINHDGSEAENTITFASCRDFRGESTVRFGARPEEAPEANPQARLTTFPPSLPVTVELTSPIVVDDAAAGDQIAGRLAAPIRGTDKGILVPEGAVLRGRLMRVETRYTHPRQTHVALRWETVEVKGVPVPLSLMPDVPTSTQRAPRTIGPLKRGTPFELPRPGERNYVTIRLSGEHVTVNSGHKSQWLTVTP